MAYVIPAFFNRKLLGTLYHLCIEEKIKGQGGRVLAMPQMSEHRRFYRHPIRCPIQVREAAVDQAERLESVNISEGGLCFFCEHSLKPQTSVEVDIPIREKFFHIRARVVYSREDSQKSLFMTGVTFEDTDSLFKAKLAEEILAIEQFRESMARLEGREISEEEAARHWIAKYAKKFGDLFK